MHSVDTYIMYMNTYRHIGEHCSTFFMYRVRIPTRPLHTTLYCDECISACLFPVCAPTFDLSPVKTVLAAKNSRALIECRPKAAPKPTLFWSKGTELLYNSTRWAVNKKSPV